MNYLSEKKEIINAMNNIWGNHSSSRGVIFSPVYGHKRKLSFVIVMTSNLSSYHALVFVYNNAIKLYDVFKYKNHQILKVGQLSQLMPSFQRLNDYILKKLPRQDVFSLRQTNEEFEKEDNLADKGNLLVQSLKEKIQGLEDKLEVYRNENQGYRDKITMLNHLIQLLRKRIKTK